MLIGLQKKYADYKVKKAAKIKKSAEVSFTKFFSVSKSVFFLLPPKYKNYKNINLILEYLLQTGKKVSIITNLETFDQLSIRTKCSFIEYMTEEITNVGTPTKSLEQKLSSLKADIIIDPTIEYDMFFASIINQIKCSSVVGFNKDNSDLFYTLQVAKDSSDPEKSFVTMLSTLKMF